MTTTAAVVARTRQKRATRAEIIEDIEWLLESRESPDIICMRIGRRPLSLHRQLLRWGRADLARHFDAIHRLDREGRWPS